MAEFIPFRALRYDTSRWVRPIPLSDLICPPYDVIDEAERQRLLARSPYNFVRIELPEEGEGDKYARAAQLLARFIAVENVLNRDGREAFYLHEHEFEIAGRRVTRRGLFGALRLYPQSKGVVMPHELTFPKAKADRLELLRATRANTSPVFGMFADETGLMGSLGESVRIPVGDAVIGAEHHRLHRIDDHAALDRISGALRGRSVYIADGHHRYETALTYLESSYSGVDPKAPERYVLAFLCALDDPGLHILATHRIVRGSSDALEAAVAQSFDASEIDRGALGDIQPGIVISRDGQFRALALRASTDLSPLPEAWRTLPVAIAEELLVKPARQAGAEITYEHDTERAIAAGTAILLRAMDPPTLRRVADAGEKLPQKTTYFFPKVPAGLVVRTLEP